MAHRLVLILCLATLLAGCSTYGAQRYASSPDSAIALKSASDSAPHVSVTALGNTTDVSRKMHCRAVGPILPPDEMTFPEYIHGSLVDELRLAGVYDPQSTRSFTGKLTNVEFSSHSGYWVLAVNMKNPSGDSFEAEIRHDFPTSFVANDACDSAADALMPAVQDLVYEIIKSPEFKAGLN